MEHSTPPPADVVSDAVTVDRPVARVMTIHTKNYVEGETIRDSRNRRVFDSLSRSGAIRSKADMIVVSIGDGGGGDATGTGGGGEAVFVSCDCESRVKTAFLIDSSDQDEWVLFGEDFLFQKEIKVSCACEKPVFVFFTIFANVLYRTKMPISRFFVSDRDASFNLKFTAKCKCPEFVLEIKRVKLPQSSETMLHPCFPFFEVTDSSLVAEPENPSDEVEPEKADEAEAVGNTTDEAAPEKNTVQSEEQPTCETEPEKNTVQESVSIANGEFPEFPEFPEFD